MKARGDDTAKAHTIMVEVAAMVKCLHARATSTTTANAAPVAIAKPRTIAVEAAAKPDTNSTSVPTPACTASANYTTVETANAANHDQMNPASAAIASTANADSALLDIIDIAKA